MSRLNDLPVHPDAPRRTAAQLLLLGMIPLLLSACTQESPALPPVTTTTVVERAEFPLRIVRKYVGPTQPRDRNADLTVQNAGEVLGRTGNSPVSCTLTESSLEAISTAAVRIDQEPAPTASESQPTADPPVVTWLGSPATGLVDVSDPRLSDARPVIEQILQDVSAPVSKRLACR